MAEYVEHYHCEHNHQGLDNRVISGPPMIQMTSRVRCRPRLGGLLNSMSVPRERQIGREWEHYGLFQCALMTPLR